MLLKTSPGDQDRYELEQTLSCMKPVLIELNKMAERLPKREVYLRFVPKTIDSAATMRVQELVQNLSGIDEETRKRLYHSVAEIIMGEMERFVKRQFVPNSKKLHFVPSGDSSEIPQNDNSSQATIRPKFQKKTIRPKIQKATNGPMCHFVPFRKGDNSSQLLKAAILLQFNFQ